MAKSKRDIHQEVTDTVIKAMENSTGRSAMPWDSKKCGDSISSLTPANAVTGKGYSGINRLLLLIQMAAHEGEYTENRWVTYTQAKNAGWQVRRREKSVQLCYYNSYTKEDANGEEKDVFFLNRFNVFNVAQLDGYEKAEEAEEKPSAINENSTIAQIIANTDVKILSEGGDRAFYVPALDVIQMPPHKAFKSQSGYESTLVHEISHAVGHHSRLDRRYQEVYGQREGYAREELVAELSAAFIASELGYINETLEFHASYLKGWLSVLKNDKKAIFKAATAAQKTADFIIEKWGSADKAEQAA